MGAILAILAAGGAIAFAAFKSKAFQPQPDKCHQLKNAVEDYGGYAGPDGVAAAEIAKSSGDTLCAVFDEAQEAAAHVADAAAPLGKFMASIFAWGGGPPDPDEMAQAQTKKVASVGDKVRDSWLNAKWQPDPKKDKISFDCVYNYWLKTYAYLRGVRYFAFNEKLFKELKDTGKIASMGALLGNSRDLSDQVVSIHDAGESALAAATLKAYEDKYKRKTPLPPAGPAPKRTVQVGTNSQGSTNPATSTVNSSTRIVGTLKR